jgi:adenylate kinase
MGMPLEKVIALDIADEAVVERLGGRLTCPNCGEIYHMRTRPPKVDHLCDKCGSELIVRPDDQPETIRERLQVFHQNTEPVEKYYEDKGMVQHVDGSASPDQVFQSILDALSG